MSSEKSAPGYAEQIRRIIYDVYGLASFAGPRLDASIESAVTAIAALPAPDGEEVAVEDIAPIICEELFGIYVASELAEHSVSGQSRKAASAILSRFTILAKPAQEIQGS